MVGSGEAGFDTKALIKGSHKMGGELRAAVGEDFLRNSMEAEYVGVMEVSSTFGCECRLAQDEVSLIRVVINIDTDGIKAL